MYKLNGGRTSVEALEPTPHNPTRRDGLLLEIANLLTTQLDTQQLFQTIAQVLRHVAPIERASLALYDRARDGFEVVALALQNETLVGVGSVVPHKGSRAGVVFDTRQPLFCPSLEPTNEFYEDSRLLQEGLRTSLCVPLIVRDNALGTFNVDCRCQAGLTPDDVELIRRLADQIAIAVANSQAFETMKRANAKLERENEYLSRDNCVDTNLITNCPSMAPWIGRLHTVAKVDATVLITGETGTGKGVVARAIHEWSTRRQRAFVKCDCPALAPTLLESELFGHEKGAFTGAHTRRIGRFELADGGTLFLDEVGEIPPEVQAKLLGVLEDRQIQRVGSSNAFRVDIRVIAATNRDLNVEVGAGRFRQDLLYRLNVLNLHLPPLRDRPEDIQSLAEHFLRRYSSEFGVDVRSISPTALKTMRSYSWPGNIREMANVIERAILLGTGPTLNIPDNVFAHDGSALKPQAKPQDSRTLRLVEVEAEHIRTVLNETGWRIDGPYGAAKILGLHPNTLRSRMNRLGIQRPGESSHARQSSTADA